MSDEHPDPGELGLYWYEQLPEPTKDSMWIEFIMGKFKEANLTEDEKTRLERDWREWQDAA